MLTSDDSVILSEAKDLVTAATVRCNEYHQLADLELGAVHSECQNTSRASRCVHRTTAIGYRPAGGIL